MRAKRNEVNNYRLDTALSGNNSGFFLTKTLLRVMFMFFGCYGRLSLSLATQEVSEVTKNLINSGFVRFRLNLNIMKLKESELRKADRTVGVNSNIFSPIFRQARPDFFKVCLQLRKDVTI